MWALVHKNGTTTNNRLNVYRNRAESILQKGMLQPVVLNLVRVKISKTERCYRHGTPTSNAFLAAVW